MGETVKRGPLVTLVVMVMILLRPIHSRANSSIKGNGTFLGESRIDEPEFIFDSEISRMLVDFNSVTVPATGIANKPVFDCSRKRYKSCLPQKNPTPKGEVCGAYNRGCPGTA